MEKNDSNVKSVEKALKILLCFGQQQIELSLSEIAEMTHITLPTAFRLAGTLVNYGFLEKNAFTGKYAPGESMGNGGESLAIKRLKAVSMPVMQKITLQTQETTNLFSLSYPYRTCIAQVDSPHLIKYTNQIGSIIPIWQGTTGKVFAAYLNSSETDMAASLGEKSSGLNRAEFFKELQTIKEAGYACRVDPSNEKGGNVTVPVLTASGRPEAALAIIMPSHRYPKDPSHYADLLKNGASRISELLGW